MKLYISSMGLTEPISTFINDAKQDLNSAKSRRSYCPNDFKYASYINNLGEKINKFSKETTYINNSLVKSERKYNSMFDRKTSKIDNLTEKRIDVRTGISEVI